MRVFLTPVDQRETLAIAPIVIGCLEVLFVVERLADVIINRQIFITNSFVFAHLTTVVSLLRRLIDLLELRYGYRAPRRRKI